MAHPLIEVAVDEALARALLVDQHPDLADLPLRWVGTGWDNALWRLGDTLALRFPVREAAAHLVEHEQEWLPRLAPRLPVAVPSPVRVGRPALGYPWAWSVVPWFDAVAVAHLPVPERSAWATSLADVFVALHVPAPDDAPDNPVRGDDIRTRLPVLRERVERQGLADADAIVERFVELAAAPTWHGPPVWIHGDPHPANLLAHDGALAAVIDWGDVTSGDPACDLATAWLTFDESGRAAFRERVQAGSRWDDDVWRRAQAWALHLSVVLQTHADEYPHLAAVGRHGLAHALT